MPTAGPPCRMRQSSWKAWAHTVVPACPLAADTVGMMTAWTDIVACGTALWVRKALAKRNRGPVPG